jgi:hypothetical protein
MGGDYEDKFLCRAEVRPGIFQLFNSIDRAGSSLGDSKIESLAPSLEDNHLIYPSNPVLLAFTQWWNLPKAGLQFANSTP